jgi:hemerythrin-like domain-containing protein
MQPMQHGDSGLRYRMRRALRQIGEQHRQLREILGRLEAAAAAGDRGELRDAFVRYRHAIGAHFELEDAVFFPALHGLHPEEQEPLEALSAEHGGLLAELQRFAALVEAPALEAFGAAFAGFRARLDAHERLEESLVSRLA